MKNFTLLLAILFNTAIIQVQSFSAGKDTVKFNGKPNNSEINARIYLNNNTGNLLNVRCIRIIDQLEQGWETSFCNKDECFGEEVDTADITIPGGGSNYLLVHFYPNGIEGEGIVRLRAFDKDDPDSEVVLTFVGSTQTPTGILQSEKISFSFYPNPVEDILTIEYSPNGRARLQVFNSIGQAVYTGFIEPQTKKNKISFGSFPSGVYFVKIEDGDKKEVKRVVKQ